MAMNPPTSRVGGGPLQSRQAPNGQTARIVTNSQKSGASSHASSSYAKPTQPHSATARSHHHPAAARQAPAPPKPSSHAAAPPQPAPATQPAPPANKPQSRLEREKKKDYKDPPNIGPWKLGKLIGQGASGRVRIAQHATTGQQAAVKIVPRQLLANSRMSLGELSQKQDKLTLGIEREIVIMKLIEHPNLLGLWDVYETSKEL